MHRRLVVLILIKGLGIGGAERLISEAAPHWDRESFDYRVGYLLPWKNQLVPDLEAHGVEVRLLGGRRGTDLASPWRLRSYAREIGADLVHAHLPAAGILARVAAPIPVIYTEHNLVSSYRPLTRSLNRLTYRRNRAVTAVSAAVANEVLDYRGPKVEVIENGVSVAVDPGEVSAVRQELGLDSDRQLVVHVGNIRPHKGHANLIAGVRWLIDHGVDALVVSIGGEKYEGDLARVRAAARSSGVDASLKFLGRRPEAQAFMAAADVVVNPADVEGLPVSLLEAMALSRPVVATAVGGVPGLVEDGVTGVLVPPRDPARLGEAIAQLLSDRALAESVGRRGSEVVVARYGLRPMVAAFEDLYRRVAIS